MKFLTWGNGTCVLKLVSLVQRQRHCAHFSLYLWKYSAKDTNSTDEDVPNTAKLLIDRQLSKNCILSFGHGFMIASTDNRILVSGVNTSSQLGLPSSEANILHDLKEIKLPFANTTTKILDISCGRLHTAVATTEGLFMSGCNRLGQCGLGESKETDCFTKVPWTSQLSFKQVICGLDHTLLLTCDGNIWSTGWGADGQTGLGQTDEQWTFAQVTEGLQGIQIKQLASKADSCLALTNCGSVFSWGNSEYSQVGFPTKESLISTPTKLSSLENVIDIAIGGSVGLALTVKGEVFSWGYGLLGNDVNACFRATPQKVETYFDECVVKVASGLDFHVMLTENGNLYAWGRLGGDTTSRTPEQVILPSKVVRVSCGFDTMAIFTED